MHALKWYFVLQLCCSAVTCTRKTIRSEILRCFYRRWGKICVENVYSCVCVCVWAYWQWSGNVLSTAALKRWRADIQHAAVHRGWGWRAGGGEGEKGSKGGNDLVCEGKRGEGSENYVEKTGEAATSEICSVDGAQCTHRAPEQTRDSSIRLDVVWLGIKIWYKSLFSSLTSLWELLSVVKLSPLFFFPPSSTCFVIPRPLGSLSWHLSLHCLHCCFTPWNRTCLQRRSKHWSCRGNTDTHTQHRHRLTETHNYTNIRTFMENWSSSWSFVKRKR